MGVRCTNATQLLTRSVEPDELPHIPAFDIGQHTGIRDREGSLQRVHAKRQRSATWNGSPAS
jgi:hypothetical protein